MMLIGGSLAKMQSGLVAQAAHVAVDTRRAMTCVSTTCEDKSNDRANVLKATKNGSVKSRKCHYAQAERRNFLFQFDPDSGSFRPESR